MVAVFRAKCMCIDAVGSRPTCIITMLVPRISFKNSFGAFKLVPKAPPRLVCSLQKSRPAAESRKNSIYPIFL